MGAIPWVHAATSSLLRLLVGLAVALASLSAGAVEVLFIGNSYTYGGGNPTTSYNHANVTDLHGTNYGGIPGIFKKFCDQQGLSQYNVSVELVGGKTLKEHYVNWRALVASKAWDIVVLQEQSYLSLSSPGDPTDFYTYAQRLEQFVHGTAPDTNANPNPAAKVFLYQTPPAADAIYANAGGTPWAGTSIENMVGDTHNAYYSAAGMNSAIEAVIPVGDAWILAVNRGVADRNPYDGIDAGKINLWQADNHHPSSQGNYLDAAIIWGKLTGKDPRVLGASEAAAAALGVTPSQATTLQTLAWMNLGLSDGQGTWTTVYSNDFDAAPVVQSGVTASGLTGGGVSAAIGSYSGTDGKTWAGQFFRNASVGIPAQETALQLQNLPVHNYVSIDTLLGFLDSWDSTDGNVAPDYLDVFLDDVRVARLTAGVASGSVNNYGGGSVVAGATQIGASTSWKDRLVDMNRAGILKFPHTGSTLKLSLRAGGAGWQGGDNESWGVDSLRVKVWAF